MTTIRTVFARIQFLTWPAFVLAVTLGLTLGVLGVLILIPRNPIIVGNVHEVDGVVVRGQWLELDFSLTRSQNCGARVERWLWHWTPDGLKHWVQLDMAGANPPTKLGSPSRYILAIPVPASVSKGDWFYWSRTYDYCGLRSLIFGENVRESGNIPVSVIDPLATTPPQVVTGAGAVLVVPAKE